MGLNVAYQLLRRDPRLKVKIFERSNSVTNGSSGASSSILRTYYTHVEMSQFAVDGINLFKNWSEYLNMDSKDLSASFIKTGLLIFNPTLKSEAKKTINNYKIFLNQDYSMIDNDELNKRWPNMINNDVSKFDYEALINGEDNDNDNDMDSGDPTMADDYCHVFEENAGYFESTQAMTDIIQSLKLHYNNNFKIEYNSKVTDILFRNHHVTGIKTIKTTNTDGGDININTDGGDAVTSHSCPLVINCNGPWYYNIIKSNDKLNDILNIPFSLKPVRIQVIHKQLPLMFDNFNNNGNTNKDKDREHRYDSPVPIIVDSRSGIYIRPQIGSKQLIVGSVRAEDECDEIKYNSNDKSNNFLFSSDGADPEMRERLLQSMYHRLSPYFETNNIQLTSEMHSLNGIYTMCEEDVHPIIGKTNLDGFIVCNGFSGHGFKCAPSVGSIIAQNVTGIKLKDDTKVLIDIFSPYRDPLPMTTKNVMA